jgi:hypothetical protein
MAEPTTEPTEEQPAPAGDELERTRNALKKANKEAEEFRRRLKEFEDSGKSEVEKLTAQVAELTARAERAEADRLRTEVAIEKGLKPAQARRLSGTSREELEADADELLSLFGATAPSEEPGKGPAAPPASEGRPDPVGRPRPSLLGGGDPAPPEPSIREVIEALPRS